MSLPTVSVDMVVDPFFLDSPGGRLFAVHHRPRHPAPPRGHVLCVAPFNEEMNRCRSMITQQAQAFGALGFGTLVFDLHGTGDSEGDYRDARWSTWQDSIRTAQDWLSKQPGGLKAILGTRLGAVLAAQAYVDLADPGVALILWQPVIDGKTHLTQFLRLRMAAQLDRPDLPKETTALMRNRLGQGHTVEVAGYEIHPELARAMDEVRLFERPLFEGAHVLWLENASPDKPGISPLVREALQDWRTAGVSMDARTYPGPAFWQVHERVLAPALIEQTSAWLDEKVGHP